MMDYTTSFGQSKVSLANNADNTPMTDNTQKPNHTSGYMNSSRQAFHSSDRRPFSLTYPTNPTTLTSFSHDLEKGYTQDSTLDSTQDYRQDSSMGPQIQKEFVKKIYSLLSLQLLITWGVSLLFTLHDSIREYVLANSTPLYLSVAGTFLFLFLSFCYGRQHPHGLWILLGFTLCESYSIGVVSVLYDANSVLLAWGLTLSIFVGLTIYVHTSKADFEFLGMGLLAGLYILIFGGIYQIFFSTSPFFNTAMSCLGALVAVGYILYDTSEIIHRLSPDDYVFACMSLYLDILMLFLRILELINGDSNK